MEVNVAKTVIGVLDDPVKNLDDPLMLQKRLPVLKAADIFPDKL